MKSRRLAALGAAMVMLVSLAVVGAAGARPDTASAFETRSFRSSWDTSRIGGT